MNVPAAKGGKVLGSDRITSSAFRASGAFGGDAKVAIQTERETRCLAEHRLLWRSHHSPISSTSSTQSCEGRLGGRSSVALFFSSARSSLLNIMKLLAVMVVVTAGLVSGMDVGKGGVYDSPMAQDYYVKRFGFMFGGGRSGMYGLKALQADGLVAQKKEVKPAVQMRNSVDTYYRNVLPTSYSSSYTFNRLRSKPLLRAKPMVKLAPKKMGSTYFNTFMAVP